MRRSEDPGTWMMDGQVVDDDAWLAMALGAPAIGRPSLYERGYPLISRPKPLAMRMPFSLGSISPAPSHSFSIHINPECTRVDAVCNADDNRRTVTLPFEEEPPLKFLVFRLGYREDEKGEFQFVSEETAERVKK
ncbi:MAG: hypothetical protein GY842_26965, partial [bacterium]|nr:hypothetical protein [bacterium]